MSLYEQAAPLLFRAVDAERAHGLAVRALRAGVVRVRPVRDPRLRTTLLGLDLPNPLGMAAGFDKNAEVPDAVLRLGFGFTEVGTVTPVPQPGNPAPRMFRLPADRAVVNRLGFNNAGHGVALANLSARHARGGVIGVNVGANKDAADRIADYADGIRTFTSVASYFTVNVSSPNTPGLRDLQAAGALRDLLARCLETRDAATAAHGRRVPVLLKLAPDLSSREHGEAVEVALECGVDGLVLTNTTLARDRLIDRSAGEAGGLSGRPLMHRSTVFLARTRLMTGPALPIIGVGGVADGHDLFEKLRAGADAVQLYTGFVYGGPATARHALLGLLRRMEEASVSHVRDLVGSGTRDWAARTP